MSVFITLSIIGIIENKAISCIQICITRESNARTEKVSHMLLRTGHKKFTVKCSLLSPQLPGRTFS